MNKAIFAILFGISGFANAALIGIGPVVPTGWRAENYVPARVVLWYTGSSCANQQLTLPSTATTADHSRLYATVMSAKSSGQKIFVIYDDAQAGCPISSFGVQ